MKHETILRLTDLETGTPIANLRTSSACRKVAKQLGVTSYVIEDVTEQVKAKRAAIKQSLPEGWTVASTRRRAKATH